MANYNAFDVRGLLAALLLSCTGCGAQLCYLPDDCAHAFRQTQLGWELHDVFQGSPADACGCGEGLDCGCEVYAYDEVVVLDEPRKTRRPRISVGPPPESYEPPMPPKFLPVPARSVFSSVKY